MHFYSLLAMICIGWAIVGIFVIRGEKRRKRREYLKKAKLSREYDEWFEKSVHEGLKEEQEGNLESDETVERIFKKYMHD